MSSVIYDPNIHQPTNLHYVHIACVCCYTADGKSLCRLLQDPGQEENGTIRGLPMALVVTRESGAGKQTFADRLRPQAGRVRDQEDAHEYFCFLVDSAHTELQKLAQQHASLLTANGALSILADDMGSKAPSPKDKTIDGAQDTLACKCASVTGTLKAGNGCVPAACWLCCGRYVASRHCDSTRLAGHSAWKLSSGHSLASDKQKQVHGCSSLLVGGPLMAARISAAIQVPALLCW